MIFQKDGMPGTNNVIVDIVVNVILVRTMPYQFYIIWPQSGSPLKVNSKPNTNIAWLCLVTATAGSQKPGRF